MADAWPTVASIAGDSESGAAEIARAAAETLGTMAPPQARVAIGSLLRAHPEMAPLWRLATNVSAAPDPAQGAAEFLRRLDADRAASSALAPRLPPTVLTISYSSSVLDAVRQAPVELLLCMRSEPGGEGARMAAAASPIHARVLEDEDAIEGVPAAAVLTGADAVTPAGLINKLKTGPLAVAANRVGIPCYAVAGEAKFLDAELPVAPMFERVPLDLFTAIATPFGLLTPAEAAGFASRAALDPALLPLLEALSGNA
jgi:translation initiation factor 2B subunit (eIF-2B alpha/beta/delta family)